MITCTSINQSVFHWGITVLFWSIPVTLPNLPTNILTHSHQSTLLTNKIPSILLTNNLVFICFSNFFQKLFFVILRWTLRKTVCLRKLVCLFFWLSRNQQLQNFLGILKVARYFVRCCWHSVAGMSFSIAIKYITLPCLSSSPSLSTMHLEGRGVWAGNTLCLQSYFLLPLYHLDDYVTGFICFSLPKPWWVGMSLRI